jgi:hypothetical protein
MTPESISAAPAQNVVETYAHINLSSYTMCVLEDGLCECVCVCECEAYDECVCVCVRERERARDCVYVYVQCVFVASYTLSP